MGGQHFKSITIFLSKPGVILKYKDFQYLGAFQVALSRWNREV